MEQNVLADHLDTRKRHLLVYDKLFLEWSKGGILTPSSLMRGAKERRDDAILERTTKRSLLLKKLEGTKPWVACSIGKGCE